MAKYDSLTFHVPPRNQGQTVEVAFGFDVDRWRVVKRVTDRAEPNPKPEFWVAHADSFPEEEEFDFWNRAPRSAGVEWKKG